MQREVTLRVNGMDRHVQAEPARSLLTVLRDELYLTGTKYGCGEGQCGACTVLVGDVPRRSCRLQLHEVAGRAVTTIEGVEASDGTLHPVQQLFLEAEAFQCGYCTAGMIMTIVGALRRGQTAADVRRALDGHVCRCCTYLRIDEVVRRATGGDRGGR